MSTENSSTTADSEEVDSRVFDAWINLPYAPGEVTPDPSVVARFKRGDSAYEGGQTMSEIQTEDPDRFVTSVGIDPRLGYEAARHVRIAVREYGIKCFRVVPMFTGIAIDDKLAYPMYTAACDEGAVVSINVGVPGPMKPARLQRTILVDEVALTFPELRIVMSHLGDPWTGETVSMLVKHPNVFAMTAGWAPKYIPGDILSVARKRNKAKLMWASDYPILPFDRTITEGRALDLPDDSRRNFLGANALAVFGEPPAGTDTTAGTGDR